MKKLLLALLCVCTLLSLPLVAHAQEEAQDISKGTKVSGHGYNSFEFLTDKKTGKYRTSGSTASITLENEQGIGSLYLLFNKEYGAYTVTDNITGQTITAGSYGFLHEYMDLEGAFGKAPTSVTLLFDSGKVVLSEIYVFSTGQVPDFVQRWAPPLDGGADILMMPTHGDDDQLYFAGLLPYYAGELDLRVQVVYMTDHRDSTTVRTHEMLNGLWSVGVDVYPVFGSFADFREKTLAQTYSTYQYYGTSRDDILRFVVEQLRRFKPMVVVGHDLNGEYGHGMHMAYADTLMEAVEISNDPEVYPDLAQQYGLWDVPKTYLHLWKENPIVLDYDTPLERFDGLTAFQVTQKYGFPCHVSQQDTMFFKWLYGYNGEITKASQISKYNPCQFGLYRTTVGADVAKNDFMENVTTYAELDRIEQERLEQERLEQERLEQERLEQERLEQERLEQERLEQEKLEQERLEQERLEQERIEQEEMEKLLAETEAKIRRQNQITLICLIVVFLAASGIASRFTQKAMKKNRGLYERKKVKK